jgi:predicted site-specific integrase-resolvase
MGYCLQKLLAKLRTEMVVIGYARVSTQDQDFARQVEAPVAGPAYEAVSTDGRYPAAVR